MRAFNQPSQSQSRSDAVRQRRSVRREARSNAAAGRVVNPLPPRQVVMRGGSLNSQANSRAGTRNFGQSVPVYRQGATLRPRRPLYVPMDHAGAELRLPAIPLINPGWRLLSGLLVILLAVAVFSMWNSPFFRITTVDVRGLERLSAQDLDAVLRLENLSIIEVNAAALQEEIAASFPELTDVQVAVELPNFVTISAQERQPVMAWKKGETTLWVDPEGAIFPARGEVEGLPTVNTEHDLPLVPVVDPAALAEGEAAEDEAELDNYGSNLLASQTTQNQRADLKLITATLQLVKSLPEGTHIVYDEANGLGWNDPGGWQVYIGKDMVNFDEKFNSYQTILQKLQDRGIRPTLISVEHLNAPFYRAAEQPEE